MIIRSKGNSGLGDLLNKVNVVIKVIISQIKYANNINYYFKCCFLKKDMGSRIQPALVQAVKDESFI